MAQSRAVSNEIDIPRKLALISQEGLSNTQMKNLYLYCLQLINREQKRKEITWGVGDFAEILRERHDAEVFALTEEIIGLKCYKCKLDTYYFM